MLDFPRHARSVSSSLPGAALAAAFLLCVGSPLQSCGQGCNEENACKKRTYTSLLTSEIPTMCGVEAELEIDGSDLKVYRWTMSHGQCGCLLAEQQAGKHFWEGCTYDRD